MVRVRGGNLSNFDVFEVAKGPCAVARAIQQDAVEGITFSHAQFPPDHAIERLGITDNIDAVDVNTRTFIDMKGHVDRMRFEIGGDFRAHINKGITSDPGDIGQAIN